MTPEMPDQLHLVKMRLSKYHLERTAQRRRHPRRANDPGYAVHCVLRESFDGHAPRPFRITSDRGDSLVLLGYSYCSGEELVQHAQAFAQPDNWRGVAEVESKPMPDRWSVGRVLGFDLRAVPAKRENRRTVETDTFLIRCRQEPQGATVDREETYVRWLGEELKRQGGAELIWGRMSAFRLADTLRPTHRKKGAATAFVRRPDVILIGEMKVTDPEKFAMLLRTGIGKARAFGYGMVLLKAPSSGRWKR